MSADQPTVQAFNSFFSDVDDCPKPQLDRFDFRRKLGEGSFGEVWQAWDREQAREVAIKLSHPATRPVGQNTQRLLARAQRIAALEHPHIVPLFDVGETSDGRVYFVSRYVDGSDLADQLRTGIPDLGFTVRLIATIADALAFTHDSGLIHRAIRPSGILIESATQTPLLADFGFSVTTDIDPGISLCAGTVAYLSPEQASATARRVDHRSDIFSLGGVLYQMLTGQRPFSGSTAREVHKQIMRSEPESPRSLNPGVPEELEEICLRALRKKRSDRFASAAEMAKALRVLKLPKPADDSGAGVMIGPYRIGKILGEGGMGTVYEAEQIHPVRRRVAVKVIRSGLHSGEVQRRFEAERQALAMMEHPNIAKVLDAGVTGDGRPYFAMELVRGDSITKYCDRHKLSLDERLELFMETCKAVQHAHQKGIIHRDIKPSNVLVSQEGDGASVRVIDFGLAKALQPEQRLTDQSLVTDFGRVLGTLQYMSPEQAGVNALDVDTRTDVYSLGVLLYELLTGSTPLEQDSVNAMALERVLAAIREQDPPRPSQRLSSLGDSANSISQLRKTDVRRLSLVLKGDLDWIAMKALEKERTRRYESAAQFAEDIQRYMNGETVLARPPSLGYWFGKTARRHKVAIAVSVTGVCLLLAGITGTTWQMLRAQNAERVAEDQAAVARVEAENARDAERSADLQREEARSERDRATAAEAEAISAKSATEATLARANYLLAVARWEENRAGEAIDLLDRVPLKHRHLEWNLARRQFEGSEITCVGHTLPVCSVSVSPDGRRIASGSQDRTVRLWDAGSGVELRTLKGHTDVVTSVAFSPDGSRIASAGWDRSIKVWDVATGAEVRTLEGHSDLIHNVVFSHDGRWIASASADKTVWIWDTTSGEPLRKLSGHSEGVWTAAFSPDGTQIASGSADDTIRIWDAVTGKELRTLEMENGEEVTSLAFSRDGSQLVFPIGFSKSASHGHHTIRIRDVVTGAEVRTLQGHTGAISSVALSPDGKKIASGSHDRTIKVWNVETGAELTTLKGHTDFVRSAKFTPDNAGIVSAGWDRTIKLWSLTTGGNPKSFGGHDFYVESVAFSPDGRRIASASHDTIRIRDASSFAELMTLKGHTRRIVSVAFSRDGKWIASGSYDRTIRLWDSATGAELRTLSGHAGYVTGVAFSPDGTQIASGSLDGTIRQWDVESGQELRSLKGHNVNVTSVAFSPDGSRIASGGYDRTVRLWDADTGAELLGFTGHTDTVSTVTFSPDGTRIASGGFYKDRTIRIWDVTGGAEIHMLVGHNHAVTAAVFNADGTRLASGSWDQTVKIWDTVTGEELRSLTPNADRIGCVTFSPDGSQLAAGCWDRTVQVWDAAAYDEITDLSPNHDAVVVADVTSSRRADEGGESSPTVAENGETPAAKSVAVPRLVFSTAGWSGSVSPTGHSLVFRSQVGRGDLQGVLYVCELKTGTFEKLADSGKDQAWSPDGSRVAYCLGEGVATEVHVTSLDGSTTENIGPGYLPSWSNDASTLYFRSTPAGRIMRCDLSAHPRTTEVAFDDTGDHFAQVSPDGSKIVFTKGNELVVVERSSGRELVSQSVAEMGEVMKTWNSDGTHVAFGGFGNDGIRIMNASTGRSLQILDGTYVNPRWSADGRFMSVDNRRQGVVDVYEVAEVELP